VAQYAKYELEGRLAIMMQQLKLRLEQYEVLKTLTVDQIVEMYSQVEFKEMHDKWRKSLEIIFPSGFNIDDKLLVEFHL